MFRLPGRPRYYARWNQPEPCPFKRPSYCRSPRLRPDAFSFMVPPGHRSHEQGPLIAKGVDLVTNPPVMNQTGIANRSPAYKDGHTSHHVVYHLPKV